MEFYNLDKTEQEIVLWAIDRSLAHEYKRDNDFQEVVLQGLKEKGVINEYYSLGNKSIWLSRESIQEVITVVKAHIEG